MKYSYTHNNQRFSVVVLKDCRVMEIRRGDTTFCADQRRQSNRWASVEAWRATWPDGAVKTNSSSSPRHPIIQRCFRRRPATVSTAISADKINHLQRQISECKRNIASQTNTNTNTRYWSSLQADCEDQLRECQRPYSVPQYKHTRTYVSHNGCFLPVYHNCGENIVHIRVYDPQTKQTVIHTPEELGITEKDNFYCCKWEDVFVPIA